MNERVIFHCDANSFYASVEVANNKKLIGLPVAVSGNPKTRTGIILTKNHIAKQFGVLTGEVIWQAKLKCPNLICLPPNHELYGEYSLKLQQIYLQYTDKVEPFGIDECWLDVTDTLKFFDTAEKLAFKIKEEVKQKLGITISIGISFCKIFAKLGSDLKKPDAITIINRDNYKKIVYPMPITSIIGIGKRLEIKFNKFGINSLEDITTIPDFILKKKFGVIGLDLKNKLLGNDNEPVKHCDCYIPPKSIGNGTTTILDIYNKNEVIAVVTALCDEISSRLRLKDFIAGGISVSLKTADFNHFHKSNKMICYTNNIIDLTKNAINLIDSFWNYNKPVRAIRICAFNLSNAKEIQLDMFSNFCKKKSLDLCLDNIRNKYGYYAIAPASTIKNSHLDLSRLKNVSL